MRDAKPNNVFAERDALQRENERLQREIANLQSQRNICLAVVKQRDAELEAARKVADAAVAWHECYNKINEYPAAFYALVDAVREYRARAESPEKRRDDGLEQAPPMLVFRDTKPDAAAESPTLEARIAKACDKVLTDEDALAGIAKATE